MKFLILEYLKQSFNFRVKQVTYFENIMKKQACS